MDIEKYLSNFFKGTKNPSLKAMKFLMDEFKHPEDKLKAIHIAGTNGKGSVTEIITNVLINEGYTVGKFIVINKIEEEIMGSDAWLKDF